MGLGLGSVRVRGKVRVRVRVRQERRCERGAARVADAVGAQPQPAQRAAWQCAGECGGAGVADGVAAQAQLDQPRAGGEALRDAW